MQQHKHATTQTCNNTNMQQHKHATKQNANYSGADWCAL